MSMFAWRVLPLLFDISCRGRRANGVGNPGGKPGSCLDFSSRWRAMAQDHSPTDQLTAAQKRQQSALIKIVQDAMEANKICQLLKCGPYFHGKIWGNRLDLAQFHWRLNPHASA
jgi:hypothetical protein